MPELKHIHLPGFPYLITTVTLNRKPIFENQNAADILLKATLFGRKRQWYSLLSFVIMPDHMHLIIVPTNKNVSGCMQSLKGFSAREINRTLNQKDSIWQSGFFDYILDTEEKVLSRMKYVEGNPVRKGLCSQVEDYKYSSAACREETDFGEFF